LDTIRNVESASHISSVNVVRKEISHQRLLSLIHRHITDPTYVLLESEASLVSLDFVSNFNSPLSCECFNSLRYSRWHSRLWIDLSEEIIPVEALPKIINLTPESITDRTVGVGFLYVTEIEVAVVCSVVLQKAGRNDVEVGYNVGE